MSPNHTPVRDQIVPHIEGWLDENVRLCARAPKQRWIAHRMWVELCQMGIAVAESTVRQLVRERRVCRAAVIQPPAVTVSFRAIGELPLSSGSR